MANELVYKDFLVDNAGDLVIENGRFKVGPSLQQEVKTIMLSKPGDWKQQPLIGVNITPYYNAPFSVTGRNTLARRIRLHLELDGIKVGKIDMASFSNIKMDIKR